MRHFPWLVTGGVLGPVFLLTVFGGGCGSGNDSASDSGSPSPDARHHDATNDLVVVQDSADRDGSDSSDGDSGDVEAGIVPPARPTGPKTTSTAANNFAIHQLFFGDTDTDGGVNATAWQQFGYNVDGKITTATSTNVCTLTNKGGVWGSNAQLDGNGGIDNSFGENLFPGLIEAVDPMASATLNGQIASGVFTVMFDVTGLTADTAQTATGLTTQVFGGGLFLVDGGLAVPSFTTADQWPVLASGLSKATPPFVSKQRFPDSYVVNGTWVSGSPADVNLPLSVDGNTLPVLIHHAVVTFQHTTATHASAGQISGVLKTSELVAAVVAIAGRISPSLCPASAVAGLVTAIDDAQDILVDGTNRAGTPCDAISIGLGFTADEVAQPDTLAVVTTTPNPCDGGVLATDAGDAGGG
jgi:hypothetical protein